jgi:hypothetical protein
VEAHLRHAHFDQSTLTKRQVELEKLRLQALERLHAAASDAEGRIASGPSRVVPASAPAARSAAARAPSPAATAGASNGPVSALERLRAAMVEAEAKLLSNGKPSSLLARARSRSHSRSRSRSPRRAAAAAAAAAAAGAPPGEGVEPVPEGEAGAEGGATPGAPAAPAAPATPAPTPAPPAKASSALEQLRRALADADSRISDNSGKHWLGAHEPKWQPGPQWQPSGDIGLKMRPADRSRSPWPLVEKMRVASDAAVDATGHAAATLTHNASLHGQFWGDVNARLVGRYGTPPAVRPQYWAHGVDMEVPPDHAGRRGLAKKMVPLPKPPPPPMPAKPRSQSTGRISLSFSSPARNQYEVSLTMGASIAPTGGAMSDMPSIGTSVTKTWTHVPTILAQCVREMVPADAVPLDVFADVAEPILSEKGHDPKAARHDSAGKAEARAAPWQEPACAKEPYAPAMLRPRRELSLPDEADEAPSTSARPKPQRGPHVVRRKARKLPDMTVALPPCGLEMDPPPQVPGAAHGQAQPRPLLRPPAVEEDGDDAVFADGLMLFTDESPGAPAGPARTSFPHARPAPAAPPTSLPPDVGAFAPRRAQPEAGFMPREEDLPGRGAAKRWRMRRRAERAVVSTRTVRRGKVKLTRWEAACIIQAHYRGMESRRLMAAIKARIMLSTHLCEKGITGKAVGFDDTAMAPAALRHVKVLAEFYEKSSQGKRFAGARVGAAQAVTSRTATVTESASTSGRPGARGAPPSQVAALPARPNPLLHIYETQGEAAALEAAAREALTWTNWMVPDLAKEAEDDATLAAVHAFRDMLKEGDTPLDTRAFADRIALKAAAEVVAPAMVVLTKHGLTQDHYASATVTVANRVRDGKDTQEALGDAAKARKVPTIAHDAATTKKFEAEFGKMRATSGKQAPAGAAAAPQTSSMQVPPLVPTPASVKPARVTVTLPVAPPVKASPAMVKPARSPVVSAAVPVKGAPQAAAVPAKGRGERSWFDSAASLFSGGRGLSQAQAATRIQAAVRGMRARRQLEILKARVELRAAVAAVRDKGIAAQPAVLDRTMALGDAYLRAWNLPRAEQCYTHVLDTMERDYGRGDVRCVRPASALARVHRERGEPERAEEVMKRATTPAASPKPAAPSPPRDALSAALGGFGLFGAATAPAAAPVALVPTKSGSRVLDSAATGVQDAFASSGKALQGAADNLAGALGLGWLSSQGAKPAPLPAAAGK